MLKCNIGTLNQLLKCAKHNLYNDSNISYPIDRDQVRQCNKLKELSAKDDEDVDDLLECYLKTKFRII